MGIGFIGQLFFSTRFLVQWVASERAKRSVVPVQFWQLSIVGSVILFAYAVYRKDPVFMLGQGMGLVIYVRNLRLIRSSKQYLAS